MPNQASRYAIGVDLGGTKIDIGLVDESGKLIDRRLVSTEVQQGSVGVEKQILEAVNDLREKNKVPILGIGIGVAGQIEPDSGVVLFAPNLKWHNFPLKANIEKVSQLPVKVINDVRIITFGEWLYGAGKGYQDILCVFIGTGIGGGIVSGGRLLTGCSNAFGEVGHMTIDYNGPLCTCGKHGCFEAIAGGWGIAKKAQETVKSQGKTAVTQLLLELAGGRIEEISAKTVIEAYQQKDPLAESLIHQVQVALIAGFASLVNIYNPRRLILGGGLIEGMPEMIPIIDKGIREFALKAITQPLDVVKGALGADSGVIGAAAAIFND